MQVKYLNNVMMFQLKVYTCKSLYNNDRTNVQVLELQKL